MAAAEDALDPRFGRPRTLFFGVGAQKSATSWLDHFLRDHPEVCLPVRKEQHYWTTHRLENASDRRARVARQLRKIEDRSLWKRLWRMPKRRAVDEAWRRNDAMLRDADPGHRAYADTMFQTYRSEPVAGEITPAYALLPAAAFAEMAALGRDVRFLFVMRDPVDRLISGVRMNVRKERPGQGALPGRVAERLDEALRDPADPGILRSRYDLTINRLESVVPVERICYFFFETLFRQSEMDRLTDFLGIARRPARFEKKVNAGKASAERPSAESEARALAALAPTYEFVRARFGALVPDRWRTPSAVALSA